MNLKAQEVESQLGSPRLIYRPRTSCFDRFLLMQKRLWSHLSRFNLCAGVFADEAVKFRTASMRKGVTNGN